MSVTRREFMKLAGASGIGALALGSFGSALGRVPPQIGTVDPDRYGLMILADGLRADLLSEMVEKNMLPHIKEHFMDRGVVVDCVGTLPSTTGPAHLPFLTGTLPGTNNITGVRWVDRENRICRDYCSGVEGVMMNKDSGLEVPTLYEILGKAGEKTGSVYEIVNKGATEIKMPLVKEAWWVKGEKWDQFDAMTAEVVEEWYDKELLRFTFVWMPAVDHLAHFHGTKSETVQQAVLNVDRTIGKIVNVLEKHGIYDKTLLGLAADHGGRETEKHLEFTEHLVSLGLDAKVDLSTEGEWLSINRYNAVVAVSGNAFAHLYLCDDQGKLAETVSAHGWDWEHQKELKRDSLHHGWKWERGVSYASMRRFPISGDKKIDMIEALLDQEGIDVLLVAEKWGRYLVLSSEGQGVIERRRAPNGLEMYRYSVQGEDPLRYTHDPATDALMADGAFYSGYDWFRASYRGPQPDSLVQICQLFDSPRTGDIVVLSKPGWDLMDQGHLGSHGAIAREEMLVPVAFAGPGIVKRELSCARTVDVFPTYLEFFGLNPAPLRKIDGRTLDIFA